MLRLRVLLQETVRTWVWTGEPLRLGSSADNDVVIDDPAVSRRHAVVEPDAEGRGVWLVDTGSKNGILVGGETSRRVLLVPGAVARIGHAQIQLEDFPEDELAVAIELPEALRPPWHPSTTADLTPALDDEPARALELVLEIGRTAGDRWATHERELLERARILTWAETIVVGTVGARGRLDVRLLVGRPVEEADAGLIGGALERARTSARALSDGRVLVVRGEAGRFLAALFARPGSPNRLRIALLENLARAALAEAAHDREWAARGRPQRTVTELRFPPGYVLGTSPAAQELEREIRLAIEHSGPALILGEPGVGKEAVAWIVHHSGPRASGPWRVVDATRLRGELAASELFGIEKGVATNVEKRVGALGSARGGSIFLDEIGDLALEIQSLLLRVLQEGRFLSVGGREEQVVDARFLAATNLDLEARVQQGSFRRDLLTRLEAAVVRVPRLTDRMEDLPAILTVQLQDLCRRKDRHLRGISRAALDGLTGLPWPGNFRQLRYELERAVDATPDGATLESRNFARLRSAALSRSTFPPPAKVTAAPTAPDTVHTSTTPPSAIQHPPPVALEHEELLRRRTLEALEASRGNKRRAASHMGVARSTFYEYLKRFGFSG